MNYIKKNIFSLILIIFVFSLPILSLAQKGASTSGSGAIGVVNSTPTSGGGIIGGEDSGKILNPIKADTIEGLIKVILEGVLKIGIPIIALAIIYSGFLFVAARGNPEKIGEAKNSLLYTLIGAAILLGAWGIALLISNTVGAL